MIQIPPPRLGAARPACLAFPRSPAILRLVRTAALLACLAAACGAPQRARPSPTTGSIAGLASDRDSGDPIAKVEIRVRSETTSAQVVTASGDAGLYDVAALAPGRYSLSASFAGQPLDVVNIGVQAGEITTVDLVFTLGRPERIRIDLEWGQLNQKRTPTEASNQNPMLSR